MIQSVRGAKDLLPADTVYWRYIENMFSKISAQYAYQELRTPIFEKTEVFSRSIGVNTDVVNKEMYTFTDRSGDSITLRPEGTAGLARAVIQNSLIQSSPVLRLWYFGPYFRHERPQKGRLRQFHQYGAECVGPSSPESDVEIINLAKDLMLAAGIKDVNIILNTLGSDETRKKYIQRLAEYLNDSKNLLSEDSQNRLNKNPLRILDSKAREDQNIIKNAPVILDSLDSQSSEHFHRVKELLDSLEIKYQIDPYLVRGLDYYCHTVFEFQSNALGSQDSIGGGGRYDGLFQQLGHKTNIPAVGFAMGIERILLVLEQSSKLPVISLDPNIYIAATSDQFSRQAFNIARVLRQHGHRVIYDLQGKSFKAQMREANKMNVPYTLIIGEEEVKNDNIIVKDMDNGSQEICDVNNIHNYDFQSLNNAI